MLQGAIVLLFFLLLWATFGHFDEVAVAPGKLVPMTYLQVVQPPESGIVSHVSPDVTEGGNAGDRKTGQGDAGRQDNPPAGFRALVALKTPYLEAEGKRYRLTPGMQVAAEIKLGTRTVLEYLLSPVRKTVHEAGRER